MSKLLDPKPRTNSAASQPPTDDSMPVVVVIVERQQCWLAKEIEYDVGLTLLASMSEDPACWEDVAQYWPRYRTAAVCADLPVEQWARCDHATAMEAISDHGNWLLFDLRDKRIATGRDNQSFERDATLALCTEANGKQRGVLPTHLPPWWELLEHIEPSSLSRRRQTTCIVPYTDRELLYGERFIEDLARRILHIARSGRLPDYQPALQPTDVDSPPQVTNEQDRSAIRALHELSVEVHREWLMTPRVDLQGARPRDLLHGAHEWIDAIIEGQRLRFQIDGPMVAASDQVQLFAEAPMGSEELIVYFDLCRDVIMAGWCWSLLRKPPHATDLSQLISHLTQARDQWLDDPFEGGSPPSFIIACTRRRVPRGAGVPIEGMQQCESEQHTLDCDCPICNMIDSGMFGVSFTSLDGHHLELDEDFAFSMCDTLEDWQAELREWQEISQAQDEWGTDSDNTADEFKDNSANAIPAEEFASAWSSPISNSPLPGDRHGYMKLAFRLSEIVADLERVGSPRHHIRSLNSAFRAFFESDTSTTAATKSEFKKALEQVASHYPLLLPKLCDLQSQVDEVERRMSPC